MLFCITPSFIDSVLLSYLMRSEKTATADKIEKNKMGWACSAYGGKERHIQSFGGETWRKEATWKAQA